MTGNQTHTPIDYEFHRACAAQLRAEAKRDFGHTVLARAKAAIRGFAMGTRSVIATPRTV